MFECYFFVAVQICNGPSIMILHRVILDMQFIVHLTSYLQGCNICHASYNVSYQLF